jgi:hypothetical protein
MPKRVANMVAGRDDAGNALRGGPAHAGAFDKMVLVEGLGDADRQTARDEESDRRASATGLLPSRMSEAHARSKQSYPIPGDSRSW